MCSSSSYRIHLPGRFYELNIHYGVFVGGMGNFSEIFLGNQENFRGCMESVFFNGVDVLNKAREAQMRGSGAVVHGLTWDCSPEFDAAIGDPVSFLKEDSFITFPNWISRTGAIISFKVTSSVLQKAPPL